MSREQEKTRRLPGGPLAYVAWYAIILVAGSGTGSQGGAGKASRCCGGSPGASCYPERAGVEASGAGFRGRARRAGVVQW